MGGKKCAAINNKHVDLGGKMAGSWTTIHYNTTNGHFRNRLEVCIPCIFGLCYFSGLNFREYPQNSYGLKNGTGPYLHSIGSWRSPIDTMDSWRTLCWMGVCEFSSTRDLLREFQGKISLVGGAMCPSWKMMVREFVNGKDHIPFLWNEKCSIHVWNHLPIFMVDFPHGFPMGNLKPPSSSPSWAVYQSPLISSLTRHFKSCWVPDNVSTTSASLFPTPSSPSLSAIDGIHAIDIDRIMNVAIMLYDLYISLP